MRKTFFLIMLVGSCRQAMASGISSEGIANQSAPQTGAVLNVASGTFRTQLTSGTSFYNGAVVNPLYAMENFGDIRSVQTTDNNPRGILSLQINNSAASGHFGGMKARGTPASPLAINESDYIVDLVPYPYDGFNYDIFGLLGFQVHPGSVVSNGVVDTDFVMCTSSNAGDGYERMRTTWDGITQFNKSGYLGGTVNILALPNTNAMHMVNNDGTFSTLWVENDAASGVALASYGNVSFALAGAGIVGQANSTAPSSTLVGYQTSCSQLTGTNFPTTDQYGDVCSITVTAGTWEFKTMIDFTGAVVTGVYWLGGVGTASGNNGAGISQGSTAAYGGLISGKNETLVMPNWRTSVSGSTTYYFKVLGSYSVGTPQYVGTMWATRVY